MARTSSTRRPASSGWPKRGEIYLTALDPTVGHEINKTRPALVIQNDTSNRYSAVTMVAPITSTVRLPLSPLHVLLPADSSTGLMVASVAVFNQIRAVDRTRLIKKLGEVGSVVLAQVDDAIKTAFGLASQESDIDAPSDTGILG
jgi:mRNA interferase MazF